MDHLQQQQDLKTLEKLRGDIERKESLERQIRALKGKRKELIDSNKLLSDKLAEYHKDIEEWEWFFEHSLEGLCIAGLDGYFKRVNNAFAQMLGYSVNELLAKPFSAFIHPDDIEKTAAELNNLGAGSDSVNFENRYLNKAGEWRWLAWCCPGITATTTKLYAIARDITESKESQAEMIYRATHDPLTKLFNRAAFEDNLNEAMARAQRNELSVIAMYLIDLDGFKGINDTYGHQVGDQVLRVLAERLHNNQRQGEIVCRLGGDEFAILIEASSDIQVAPLAERIFTTTCQPISVQHLQLQVGCSIGISIYPQLAQDCDELIGQADQAMYAIKKSGKGGFSLYGG